MIGTDLFWSINPASMHDVLSRLAAMVRANLLASDPAVEQITAGPASDAEMDGLPIQFIDGVAVVSLSGPMLRRAGLIAQLFGFAGTDQVRMAIHAALVDDTVHDIVLRVDSPGGSVSGLAEIGDLMAAADKPIHAVVEGMAASAAYYVASQADRILVGRNDLIGSIGVKTMLYDYSEAFENAGIKAIPIDTGDFKSAGAFGTEITEEQKADFQRIVDGYYADFVSVVARGRGISEEAVRAAGDGRVFFPDEAMKMNLIDGIGDVAHVISELRSKAKPGRSTQAARARINL